MDTEIPGYTLLSTLGKGGMATVYLAQQHLLERKVALKVMSKGLADDPSFGARFMREAKIVSQLVHPNIVTVHEVGQDDDRYFLSMEYIDGHDLRTVRKKLDLAGKIKVIEDIARALHYAGEKGYVHRDIKPENIMFRSTDGSAVLTDFGIARAVETDLVMTQTGTAIGTPHYMSPEQAKGKDVDHRSDLYGLGAVFFLLLSGRVPYDADTAIAIGIKHLTEDIPLLPAQYEPLQFIIDGLMAKNREERYQNGLHLLNDLRKIDIEHLSQREIEAERQPTLAAELPTDFAQALTESMIDGQSGDDSKRFTIELDVLETIVEQAPRSILPSFLAGLFVFFSIAVFIYFARPSYLEPVITHLEERGLRFYESIHSYAEGGFEQASAKVSGLSLNRAKQSDIDLESPLRAETEGAVKDKSGTEEAAATADEGLVVESESPELTQSPIEGFESEVSALQEVEPLPEVQVPPLIELLGALEALAEEAERGHQSLPALTAAHRDVLAYYPDHQPTLASFAKLKAERRQSVLDLAREGKQGRATAELEQLELAFADEYSNAELKALSEQVKRELQVFELLAQADQQMSKKRFNAPLGNNAVESLNAILDFSPSNEQAKLRLTKIANYFTDDARLALNKGRIVEAQAMLDNAMAIDAKHEKANAVQLEIRKIEKAKLLLASTLENADKYAKLGYLYTPEGANAYDAYQRALELDPGNARAVQGIDNLIDSLSVQVWSLVGEAKFDQAKSKLARPLILMPSNKRILAMETAVLDVASER